MKQYVLGFMFSPDLSAVVMVIKERPDWQKGLFNGIGGHIEGGECAKEAMVREFQEETGLLTVGAQWWNFITMRYPLATIECYCATDRFFASVASKTDECICIMSVANVGLIKTIDNVPHLVELALQYFKHGERC